MKQTILQSWNNEWPVVRSTGPLPIEEGVVEQATFDSIEVNELFDTVNFAQTVVGQSVLYRSMARPLSESQQIREKQAAVEEIRERPEVRQNIENIIGYAAGKENNLYKLLFGEFLGAFGTAKEQNQIEGYGYKQYRRAMQFVLTLVGYIYASETPRSTYLQSIFEKFLLFSKSRTYSLMEGPVYHTEEGFQSKQERSGIFPLAIIFKPNIFKPMLIVSIFLALWAVGYFFPADMFNFSADAIPMASIFFVPMLLVYFPVIGSYDRDSCIIPLRDIYKDSAELGEMLDALGQLDELLSHVRYAESAQHPVVMPEIIDSDRQYIALVAAKNPILAFQNPDYVANDFQLTDAKLLFVTGPNSGGKTALCKTLTQIQLLAQIGGFVSAESAKLSVADRIFYQTPEISHLDDGEGRFGTELKRTKAIFIHATAHSLVVLDEMSEGTTFEEKMESSTHILDGFFRKGCNTILITHNHQLVEKFINQGVGVAKQVEFSDDHPTYRLIDGISRVSHADRIAKKIGFSKEDIDQYLSESK